MSTFNSVNEQITTENNGPFINIFDEKTQNYVKIPTICYTNESKVGGWQPAISLCLTQPGPLLPSLCTHAPYRTNFRRSAENVAQKANGEKKKETHK